MPKSARRSLDRAIVRGVAWTGAGNWIAQMLAWVSTLLVVRILSPDDYGIVALAGLYLGLAAMLSEFGLGTAVVTIRDLPPRSINQLNSVALLVGLSFLAFSWVVALPIAHFLQSPRMVTLVRVMSIGLVATALGTVSTALLQKDLQFRFLAIAQIVQSVSSALGTLGLALLGSGYWALALGPLIGLIASNLMVAIKAPCGYAWPDWTTLRPTLHFSRNVILERFCWYAYTGSDRLVIDKWIGEAAVGLYSLASSFGMMAVEKVSVLMLRVAPAAFAAVQSDPAALRRYLLSMTEGLALVTFPISVGMVLVAHDAVPLVLGQQWSGVITPLQLLGLFAAYNSIMVLVSRVLAAIGEVRFLLHVGMITLGIMPVAFIVGARWGVAGVAAAWVIVYPFTQLPLYIRLHQRIQLRAGEYFRALWPAASALLPMALSVWGLVLWLDDLPPTASLVIKICVAATVYAVAILVFHSDRVRRFQGLMQEIRIKQEPAQPELTIVPAVNRTRLVG